jgi:hypothetical protein
MDDETERSRPSLKPLFPKLSEEELKAVEDTFHGYLEVAWRIFERLEAEGRFNMQANPNPPEFKTPRGLALF